MPATTPPSSTADPTAPEAIPAGLANRVADRVRRKLHVPGDYVPIPDSGRGELQVSQSVVVDIAREAAAAIPGVLAVSAALTDRSFRVELVLDYGLSAVAVAAQARVQARQMVRECIGLELADIDVHVVDVLVPRQDEVAPAGGPEK